MGCNDGGGSVAGDGAGMAATHNMIGIHVLVIPRWLFTLNAQGKKGPQGEKNNMSIAELKTNRGIPSARIFVGAGLRRTAVSQLTDFSVPAHGLQCPSSRTAAV